MVEPNKKLTDSDVVQVFREEWFKRVGLLENKLKMFIDIEGEKKNVISPELKVTVKKKGDEYGCLYTVDQVGDWGAILSWVDESGEHNKKVDRTELERDFML